MVSFVGGPRETSVHSPFLVRTQLMTETSGVSILCRRTGRQFANLSHLSYHSYHSSSRSHFCLSYLQPVHRAWSRLSGRLQTLSRSLTRCVVKVWMFVTTQVEMPAAIRLGVPSFSTMFEITWKVARSS